MQLSFDETAFTPMLRPAMRCFNCHDLGFEITSEPAVRDCWRRSYSHGVPHNSPIRGAEIIRTAVERLINLRQPVHPHSLAVARYLSGFTSDNPVSSGELTRRFFAHSSEPLRELARCIEILRADWLLPIGSRRGKPAGYWLITDREDFQNWVSIARHAPLTQLRTIYRAAKLNFPGTESQLQLDFNDDGSEPGQF